MRLFTVLTLLVALFPTAVFAGVPDGCLGREIFADKTAHSDTDLVPGGDTVSCVFSKMEARGLAVPVLVPSAKVVDMTWRSDKGDMVRMFFVDGILSGVVTGR